MKLAATLTLIGLSAATFALAQGCGSSDDPGSSSGGSSSGQEGKVPPSDEGSPTTATDERVFALNALYLGDTDRAGSKAAGAWKQYGYNLDGLVTNVADSKAPDLAKVCKRVEGAPASVHQDGEGGIDNAFGSQILKLLEPFSSTPSKSISDSMKEGAFTIMLKVTGLTDDAEQTNTGLSGKLLVGTKFGDTAPTFTEADDWPYIPDPQVAIDGAYINKGMFVNGKGGAKVQLGLNIQGQSLNLTINKAIITFKHNAAGKSLDEGTIAGVIRTQELIDGIAAIAGRFDTSLCSGGTVDSIKDTIRQSSDIMADGSQDPSTVCDGISIGIGFTAKRVGNPTKQVQPEDPPPDPCQGGGVDGGT